MVRKIDVPPEGPGNNNQPRTEPLSKKKLTGVVIVGAIILVAVLAAL